MRKLRFFIAIAAFLCIAPLGIGLIAEGVASLANCELNEGSVHPCVIVGHDWGETLYAMGMFPWFLLITFPLFGGVLLVWLILEIVHASSRRRRNPPAGAAKPDNDAAQPT